ncbi:MAG TPA: outer membrane protein assembly factor BamA [Terriglobales bacterium]|nr:outer membrane protein assembly factor BamA [Terriglobales bacterium]
MRAGDPAVPLPGRWIRRAPIVPRVLRLFLLSLILLLMSTLASAQQTLVEDIRIHGNRRIPAETIRARMFIRPGDVYDAAGIERDFNALWNSGYFDDLRFEREEGTKGLILHIYVKEKPTIREIKYLGLTAVTQSEVLDKFKELKVGLTQESPFDPTRVKRAEVVLKEILAAHGHKFATVTTEIRQIPPAAVSITFNIKEGPKVKVGKITFEGNKKVSSKYLRSAMKNLKPIGIPHSIILENLWSRTYDATKLSEDAERVRLAYQDKGYFKAIVEDPRTKVRDVNKVAWYFPIPQHVKLVDITIPVEEGDRYKLKEITFSGNKALSNTASLRRLFKTRDGEWFSRADISKGLEELRKAYSTLGYINETNIPNTEVDEANKTVTLKIDVDEGKQFFVRRIEFSGNTTTRDKVIRRELALEEGHVYNSHLWEISLLRLNQLNYFEALRPEQDSEVRQNVAESTVDIDLKVKEKGKNSIGLNGGVSGLAGAFVGITYETNNFLGLGETLSVAASIGNYQHNYMFGFTEPYLFDKPIQAGMTAYWRTFRYNQAQQAGINPSLVQGSTNFSALQNFSQESKGFTMSGSYAVRRSFKRFGLTYSYDNSDLSPGSASSAAMLAGLAFRNDISTVCPTTSSAVSPLNVNPLTQFQCPYLQGITTSKLVPSFSMNTIDSPLRPHSGRSYFLGVDIAGIGGNVSYLRPIAEFKQFFPMKGLRRNPFGNQTFGVRVQGSFIAGFAGKTAPPYERFYQGGDTDLRGFDVRSVSPAAFIPDVATITLTNPDGSIPPFNPNNPRQGPFTVTVPINRLVYPGGDTSIVANVEYRIPIAGPLVFAFFVDAGMDMAVLQSQLRMNPALVNTLNNQPFGCPEPNASFTGCNNTQSLAFSQYLHPVDHTNYVLRMSTGVEMQIMLPMVNAPFRLYYAYNPFRVNTTTPNTALITRDMFPPGDAGDTTFLNTLSAFPQEFRLREPRKTFRLTVATTF